MGDPFDPTRYIGGSVASHHSLYYQEAQLIKGTASLRSNLDQAGNRLSLVQRFLVQELASKYSTLTEQREPAVLKSYIEAGRRSRKFWEDLVATKQVTTSEHYSRLLDELECVNRLLSVTADMGVLVARWEYRDTTSGELSDDEQGAARGSLGKIYRSIEEAVAKLAQMPSKQNQENSAVSSKQQEDRSRFQQPIFQCLSDFQNARDYATGWFARSVCIALFLLCAANNAASVFKINIGSRSAQVCQKRVLTPTPLTPLPSRHS